MSERTSDRVENRAAHLLPEERAAGSDDPREQAEAILADSDRREAGGSAIAESERRSVDSATADSAAPDSFLERRTSEQTVTPEPPD
ncbi:hypothetical protein I0C86_11715 [Plantactinospora sp. S1510]|uniref:Uncharacterized protein n=1 Tax=Plantactinospora alkalitolerans TaxID=2789879 RepID=A0ABS0GTX2_9ACTN|nr:hypothetical protein [Plantactinospora alkalitolerans]MBF9129625.1 hypothetical protein [Plantactinospora alkalitolerans]